MTYKQIEQSREIRLWLTQIIVPLGGIMYMACPEFKKNVNNVWNKVARKMYNK